MANINYLSLQRGKIILRKFFPPPPSFPTAPTQLFHLGVGREAAGNETTAEGGGEGGDGDDPSRNFW